MDIDIKLIWTGCCYCYCYCDAVNVPICVLSSLNYTVVQHTKTISYYFVNWYFNWLFTLFCTIDNKNLMDMIRSNIIFIMCLYMIKMMPFARHSHIQTKLIWLHTISISKFKSDEWYFLNAKRTQTSTFIEIFSLKIRFFFRLRFKIFFALTFFTFIQFDLFHQNLF